MIADLVKMVYENKPQSTLYHYTSLKGLMGIVDSRTLRATEIKYLNDAAEMKHTADLLRSLILQAEVKKDYTPNLLTQLRAWLSDRLIHGHKIFVACFTGNGNLLSQWRGYCPTASGVSIGINPEKLCNSAIRQSFQVGKCVYDATIQQKIAKDIFNSIAQIAKEKGENKDTSKRNPLQSYYDVFEEIEADLLRIAALMKDPSFHEEEEWRAVSSIITNYKLAPIEYREGSSMLIPYLNFRLPESAEGNIDLEKMFLGPTPNVNISMESLSNYLSKKGASPRQGLYNSLIPYRTW